MVIPSYATLVNSKIVIPSSKTQYLAVERHFLQTCLAPLIATIRVDEFWYVETYPDVASAIKKGAVSSAKDHYTKYGYFENRLPYKIEADEAWYLREYPDIRDAVENGRYSSAQEHFAVVGYAEGRLPFANFKLAVEYA